MKVGSITHNRNLSVESKGSKEKANFSDSFNLARRAKTKVDYIYDINKNTSFWDRNYFTTVNTINEKLENMTRELIYEEQSNINIASQIDEINGLLLDIYM